jgi:hypothetical protein
MSKLGEIAEIGKTLPGLNRRERVVMGHIADCHTQRMGGNRLICECGHKEIHYNSCRDRHCPLCQGASRARWVDKRLEELLPVPYFHVVFTVPHDLLPLAGANHQLFYKSLFQSAHKTLLEVCRNPENIGGRVGGLSVLHTWTQKLLYHPHVHCIVPGGAISPDKSHWIEGHSKYLVPVRKLSLVFRGKLLSSLRKYCDKGSLFGDRALYEKHLLSAARKNFVVYAKKPFGNPAQVVKYLGRYTHRVGISEQRIVATEGDRVSFTWIDRASGHKTKRIVLPLEEFVNRFLLHLLPKGMRKIRYFGYMSNRNRRESLRRVRQFLLNLPGSSLEAEDVAKSESYEDDNNSGFQKRVCCKCGREMKRLGLNENIPCSGRTGYREVIRNRQDVHGPEPNSQVVS